MPRALEIAIDVTGIDRATASINRLAQATRALDGWGGGGGGTAIAPGAGGAGGDGMVSRAGAAMAQAVQRARRPPPSQMDRLAQALFSTRLNFGGASPLVGRTLQAIGLPTAGAQGLVTGGLIAGLAAFTAAVHQATTTLNDFGETMRLTGGTAQETAQMRRFGLGASEAANFRQRISTDPMAMMMAGRLGVQALPRPFGTVDEAGLIVRAARALEQMTDAEERLRIERELGLESVEKYIQASPEMKSILDAQAEYEGKLGEGAKAANELSLATEALSRSWQDFLAQALTPTIKFLALEFEELALLAQGRVSEAMELANTGQLGNQRALEENTQAHRDNTNALQGAFLQPGRYGGGPAMAHAIPEGWSGYYLARQMESGALGRGVRP